MKLVCLGGFVAFFLFREMSGSSALVPAGRPSLRFSSCGLQALSGAALWSLAALPWSSGEVTHSGRYWSHSFAWCVTSYICMTYLCIFHELRGFRWKHQTSAGDQLKEQDQTLRWCRFETKRMQKGGIDSTTVRLCNPGWKGSVQSVC